MNTKKDYERAAKIVRDMRLNDSDANADAALGAFVDFFALGNPRFDSERFREACDGPSGPQNPALDAYRASGHKALKRAPLLSSAQADAIAKRSLGR